MTNIEIQKYYQNESRFNGVYSRNHLSKNIKDGAYVVNLDEYADVEAHWIAMFQVMMLLIDLLSAKQYIVVSGCYTIDILIICEIIFLHILTMQPSNSLRNE